MRSATWTAMILCLLAGAPLVHAAAQDAPAGQPEPQPDQPEPAAGLAKPVETVEIPLDKTLRFVIQPTILGLVPPRGVEGFGEVFVRVVQPAENVIIAHYEIKEEVADPPADGTGQGATQTQIRRGELWSQGIEDSTAILPPLYWGDGELITNSGGLWLSATSFAALTGTGSCPIDLRETGQATGPAAAELHAAVAELRAEAGLGEDAAFTLDLIEDALYPCVVNGERVRLKAVRAADSLGLAEYWVLDDPGNPLVLKLTYICGEAGEQGGMSFIRKGGGYAVTAIDFTPRRGGS